MDDCSFYVQKRYQTYKNNLQLTRWIKKEPITCYAHSEVTMNV